MNVQSFVFKNHLNLLAKIGLRFVWGLFISFFVYITSSAQAPFIPKKGVPKLYSYTPETYKQEGKIWSIHTAPNGIVYLASDKGLLEFDGNNWNAFKGSQGNTRSVFAASDTLIYTGSDLDFGVWHKDEWYQWKYTSLYPFKGDASATHEEFWTILPYKGAILFISNFNVYLYKNQNLIKIPAPYNFSGSFAVNNRIFLSDERNGLFELTDVSLKPIIEFPQGFDYDLSGMYPFGNDLILVTKNDGLFRLRNQQLQRFAPTLSNELQSDKVFSFTTVGDSLLAYGTVLKGLFITDYKGDIIHAINKNKGIPNNTILSLHYNDFGQLWFGMDYGLSMLHLTYPVTYFYDYNGAFGTAYTASLMKNQFYLGTNQGLYTAKWDELNNNSEQHTFSLIKGTEGQVWTLQEHDQQLLIGHDRGFFVYDGTNLKTINLQPGIWTFKPYKNHLLAGTYNGIHVYEKQGKNWKLFKQMELILGSINQLIVEDDVLWVTIPNFGVIRARIDENFTPIERLIFPDSLFEGENPVLSEMNDQIGVKTALWNYDYLPEKQAFEKAKAVQHKNMENSYLPGIFETTLLSDLYSFIPIYNGFALRFRQADSLHANVEHRVVWRKLEAFNLHERRLFTAQSTIPTEYRNLKLEVIVPLHEDVQYQFKLNESGAWSDWSRKSTIELPNISFGRHTIYVRALVDEHITAIESITFWIATPWYVTWWALLIYVLILIGLVYVILIYQQALLKKQKYRLLLEQQHQLRHQAEVHQLQLQELEQKRLQEEVEQMRTQLKTKTIELANKAKENEAKNKLLETIKEKFEYLQAHSDPLKIKASEIQRLLNSYMSMQDTTFEIQMDELHQEFFKKLKAQFPGLSSNDLRLCAYLKIGLNSKEIADLLNIQPSSVYISRSRLRKKLNLETDDDLYSYLNSFE